VTGGAFSPDGRSVVTICEDGMARVWDAATAQPLAPPLRVESPVLHAAFSPNSRWLVTACGDGMARIWDAVTGLPLAPPLRHDGEVHWAEFSPDGRRLATAGGDGAVRLWDLPTAVEWPTRELGVLAHLLAGQSTGNAEGLTPLSPDEVRAAWKELAAKH